MSKMILLLVLASTAVAQADGFDVTKDGLVYRCELKQQPSDPLAAAKCADKAYRGVFSRHDSIQLCTGAVSEGPADCALKAYRGVFSREESITLCRRDGTVERAECALQAYRGPYSREEAIRLCKGSNALLVLRAMNLMNTSPDLQERVQKIKALIND